MSGAKYVKLNKQGSAATINAADPYFLFKN